MIPYIQINPIDIGFAAISPFGILMGMAIIIGIELSMWRGRQVGVDPGELRYFMWVALIAGLVGGHVFDDLFYYPSEVLAHPWSLLEIWNGLSSFGGLLGALLGAQLWKYYEMRSFAKIGGFQLMRPVRRRVPASILTYMDVVISVFPIPWFLGRLGCAIVHDHPGISASAGSWLAVAFGPGPVQRLGFIEIHYGTQPQYDLGLLEMMFTALLALGFALSWRRSTAKGWYLVAASLIYAPVRFALDFLRLDDPAIGDIRYGGLTPGQWASLLLFAFGIILGIRIHHRRKAQLRDGAGAGRIEN